jgi:hypothetical protein
MPKILEKKELFWIAGIIAVGLMVFLWRIHLGVLDYVGDYKTYVGTGQFYAGVPGAVPSLQRILKPLEPLANAALAPALGWQGSFLFIVGLFYALLGGVTWIFFRKIFKKIDVPDEARFTLVACATALFMLSYPMLRYGLDVYTETGALFFYMAGLMELWWFVRWPNWRPLVATLIACTVGFFWKEYTILPVIMMQIAILWHPLLKGQWKKKIGYLVIFDGIFLVVNLAWQAFIYFHFHYNYLDWYQNGGANHFAGGWSIFLVLKSLFALLILGWIFVPVGFTQLKQLTPHLKFFFWLMLVVPLISLGWGAVSSRLFYVLVPALVTLCLLGMWRWRKNAHDVAALSILLLAVDFCWLFLRP